MTHRVVELFRKLDSDLRELVAQTPEARALSAFDTLARGLAMPQAAGAAADGTGLDGYAQFRAALQGRLDQTLEVGALHLADFALKEVERLAATHAPMVTAGEPVPAAPQPAEAETVEAEASEETAPEPAAVALPEPAAAAVPPPTNGGAPRDGTFHDADPEAARRVADLEAELARARARLARPAA